MFVFRVAEDVDPYGVTQTTDGCGDDITTIEYNHYVCRGRRSTAARSRHGSDNRIGLSFTTVLPLRYLDDPIR